MKLQKEVQDFLLTVHKAWKAGSLDEADKVLSTLPSDIATQAAEFLATLHVDPEVREHFLLCMLRLRRLSHC